MPALDNPKHEKFAQELSKGKTQTEAYAIAGYAPSIAHASRLATNGNVKARVAELQNAGSLRVEVTIASLIQEAADIQAAAKEDKQYSAATAALTAKAKLAGLWVDKAENLNRNVDPDSLTDGQVKSRLAELRAKRDGSGGTAPLRDLGEAGSSPGKLN